MTLPKGSVAKIAKRFGVTPGFVSLVKHGKRNNLKILEALVEEGEDYEKTKRKLLKRLK